MTSHSWNCLAVFLALATVCLAFPYEVVGEGSLQRGEATAREAAAADFSSVFAGDRAYRMASGGFAFADTTGYEFPEEEEETHLIRDVALWVVVSAFVAFFLIEVFLRGDTDEPEPEDPGKQIPGQPAVIPQPTGHSP